MTEEQIEKKAIKEYVKNWHKVCPDDVTPDYVIALTWQSLDEENKEEFRDIVRRRLND